MRNDEVFSDDPARSVHPGDADDLRGPGCRGSCPQTLAGAGGQGRSASAVLPPVGLRACGPNRHRGHAGSASAPLRGGAASPQRVDAEWTFPRSWVRGRITAVVEALTGAEYAEPLAVMREYLTAVRALLAGETVMLNGEHVTLAGRLVEIDEGSRSSVEVGAGVLRAGMARVAGACADVAITWLTPPSHIENTLIPA